MLATLAWCSSLIRPRASATVVLWYRRFLTAAKIAGLVGALVTTFAFGMWFTSEPFPTGRAFIAISVNGKPIVSARPDVKFPTLHVSRVPFSSDLNATGSGHCNAWGGRIMLVPPNIIIWRGIFRTAIGCGAQDLEDRYFRVLLGTTRWRVEDGSLILYNQTDTVRYFLAPFRLAWQARRGGTRRGSGSARQVRREAPATPGPFRWPSTLIGDALYGLHALVVDAEGNDTPERKTRQRGS